MTQPYVWHDSCICVTWLIHTCVWRDSSMCVTWLIHKCDMTHPCVWHDSSICATWLIHTYVWHDSSICVTWLIHACVWHDSSICVTDSSICVKHLRIRNNKNWHYTNQSEWGSCARALRSESNQSSTPVKWHSTRHKGKRQHVDVSAHWWKWVMAHHTQSLTNGSPSIYVGALMRMRRETRSGYWIAKSSATFAPYDAPTRVTGCDSWQHTSDIILYVYLISALPAY